MTDRDNLLKIIRPEDLYTGDVDATKKIYRTLSRQWHPDVAGGDAVVFTHVSNLYRAALDKIQRGVWEGAATLTLRKSIGRDIVLPILASAPFELGQSLVGDDYAAWIIDYQYAGLVHRADWTGKFRWTSTRMRDECARYLPVSWETIRLEDTRWLIRTRKTPDLIRLRDVVTHAGGLESRHVAWIVSSLLNLACYLSHANIVHHDISPDTYFISPRHHNGALLGGWWYAAERGSAISVLPRRTYTLMPFRSRMTRIAATQTDLECIRACGRECLKGAAPAPMQAWLDSIGVGSAVDQYQEWHDVLQKAFGARRFAKLEVDVEDVYKVIGCTNGNADNKRT